MSKVNIYTILGKNIKDARKNSNISQEELAFKINSARNYIGCIERGEKHASLTTIHKIAQVLKLNVEDLVKGF